RAARATSSRPMLAGTAVPSLASTIEVGDSSGRLQSITSREYGCRMVQASSRPASLRATPAMPMSQPMWRSISPGGRPRSPSARGIAWPAWSTTNSQGEAPRGRSSSSGAGSPGCSRPVALPRASEGTRGSVQFMLDHPQPGPELGIQLVAFAHLLDQPRRRACARDLVHGDVLGPVATALADLAQPGGADEGDLLAAGAGGGGADHQHLGALGGPAGLLFQLADRRVLDRFAGVDVADQAG